VVPQGLRGDAERGPRVCGHVRVRLLRAGAYKINSWGLQPPLLLGPAPVVGHWGHIANGGDLEATGLQPLQHWLHRAGPGEVTRLYRGGGGGAATRGNAPHTARLGPTPLKSTRITRMPLSRAACQPDPPNKKSAKAREG
jgi:hypothetical protein